MPTNSGADAYGLQSTNGVTFSTAYLLPEVRNDACRKIISPFFDARHIKSEKGGNLEGALTSTHIGRLLVGETAFNSQRHERSRKLALSTSLDQYLIQLFVSGTLDGDCDGRPVVVRPGDIIAMDLSRVANTQISPGATVSLIVPREAIDKSTGGRSIHGTVLKAEHAVTRLLAGFLVSLADVAGEIEGEEALGVESGAVNLLAEILAKKSDAALFNEDSVLSRVLRSQVLSYINANLTSPSLGLDAIIARFRVSRAHLYRIFEADGGIATVIRNKRLDAAYRALTQGGGRGASSITRLAHELAFSGSNHFLRAFRARFGVTPSEARELAFSFELADQGVASLYSHLLNYANPATEHLVEPVSVPLKKLAPFSDDLLKAASAGVRPPK
ncbi:helix-turn-helix domain-containing protein [Pandoraea fibrosis]|uniref:Helix-turn-helix domain-containing protein n=1 Tax=Pandoraea fibrosis TaxID=1891094 RepID=A0ABX6HRC4_9BURK|nr:helix-turn-helix domain-containing protein [Pandoraea fibrosis]QHE93026.1 helix-turn-helix domain-containing protein [Pandoraea fibrosis]QHF13416.1 helix-turn-helix domain-containing protein [Pandoraea fibrosis]